MKKTEYNIYIAKLISKYCLDTISPQEMAELKGWIAESDANRQSFLSATQGLPAKLKNQRQVSNFKKNLIWRDIDRQVKPTFNLKRVIGAVACLVVLVVGAWMFWVKTPKSTTPLNPNLPVLISQNGEQVTLNKSSATQLKSLSYQWEKGQLRILPQVNSGDSEMVYHKLQVPKGQTLKLVLSDGSQVHLNSNSTLRYPVVFSSSKREVELTGEAFFKVETESNRKFVVKIEANKVEVLGTQFNVNGHHNQAITTTLVEGKVRVANSKMRLSKVLKPSEQIRINTLAKSYQVQKVETKHFTAWSQNKLSFKHERLDEILDYIQQLYHTKQFVYIEPELRTHKFSGQMKRFKDYQQVLRMLEKTRKIKFIEQKDKIEIVRY